MIERSGVASGHSEGAKSEKSAPSARLHNNISTRIRSGVNTGILEVWEYVSGAAILRARGLLRI